VKLVADTHIFLWWIEDSKRLSAAQRKALRTVGPQTPLYLSDISLLEIVTLVRKGRYKIHLPMEAWLSKAVSPPLVERVAISPQIAAEVAHLPVAFHGDPTDQIIVATARCLGATLLTADEKIIESRIARTID